MAKMKMSLYDFCIENEDKKYLLKEWDYSRNEKSPKEIAANSNVKAWWLCDKGHSFEQIISCRTSRGYHCPYCSGQKLLKGFNDLCTTHPELAKEWDYEKNKIKPNEVSKGSNKKIWWICSRGHSFEMKVCNRKKWKDGYNCPICSGHRVLKGYNDLVTTHPELVKEWDYEKNKIKPDEVSFGSAKKIWWKCNKGHSYLSEIVHRSEGLGCPYCSGKKVLKGFNDLCTTHPELVKEWDYEKNNIKPDEVSFGSGKKIWWVCEKGHSYISTVGSRTKGTGCTYCCGKTVLKGFNDLATIYPKLIKEWDYEKNNIKPDEVSFGSGKKIWWKCVNGHSYLSSITNKVSGCGCHYCSTPIKKILKGFNDLETTHPKLAQEWDYKKNTKKPNEISKGCNTKFWWICEKGHSYLSSVANRVNGRRCPICEKERHTSFPEQAIFYYICENYPSALSNDKESLNNKISELDIYIPEKNIAIEYDGVAWHKSKTAIERDNRKDLLCKKLGIILIRIRENGLCTLKNSINIFREDSYSDKSLEKVINEVLLKLNIINVDINISRDRQQIYSLYIKKEKEKSIAVKFPEIAKEWHPTLNGDLIPDKVSYGTSKKFWWICPNGHSYEASVAHRTFDNTGCPYCSSQKVLVGFNDLCTTNPELVKEWDYKKNIVKPEDVIKGSNKKYWWVCKEGHSYSCTLSHRVYENNGCPYCSGRKVLKGFNDLQTKYPNVINEWDYNKNKFNPDEVTVNSNKKAWLVCEKGHSYKQKIQDHYGKNHGCPYCSGNKVLKGYNDLTTTHPQILKEWDFKKNTIKPDEISSGSRLKVWWVCEEGHSFEQIIYSHINSYKKNNSGCPICSGKKVLCGFNDIATTVPKILDYWDYDKNIINPTEITKGSCKKIWFIKDGKEYNTTIHNFLRYI